jgi:two-component sensor histidine kinase
MTRIEVVRRAILLDLAPWHSVVGAMLALAVPTMLRWWLDGLADAAPYVLYCPFILFAAVFLGWRAALAVAAIATLVVNALFPGPLAPGGLAMPVAHRTLLAALFLVVDLALIAVGDTLRRTVRQLEALARQQDIVVREMFHRVQNALGVVQALIRVSRADDDPEQFRQELLGRVQALANANRLLDARRKDSDSTDFGLTVAALVQVAIAPFHNAEAFIVRGPPASLERDAAYHLLLLLHELCTNALKHGALSTDTGQVTIRWNQAGVIDWQETGGPSVRPPDRQGLGSRLFAPAALGDRALLCARRLFLPHCAPVTGQIAYPCCRCETPATRHALAIQRSWETFDAASALRSAGAAGGSARPPISPWNDHRPWPSSNRWPGLSPNAVRIAPSRARH